VPLKYYDKFSIWDEAQGGRNTESEIVRACRASLQIAPNAAICPKMMLESDAVLIHAIPHRHPRNAQLTRGF